MMMNVGGMERSRGQWEELLRRAGLKVVVRFWESLGFGGGGLWRRRCRWVYDFGFSEDWGTAVACVFMDSRAGLTLFLYNSMYSSQQS